MSGFWTWWQHIPEHLSPYIFEIGSFKVGYYGLMYLVGFLVCYLLALYRIKKEGLPYSPELMQDYIVWTAIGLILGARLGYVLFYNFGYYLQHPLEIILPFKFKGGLRFTGISGMSYHGGAIGVVVASVLFLRKYKLGFWKFSNFIVPVFPLGYMFGRIGNFINGELYGRATTMSWGMYFPHDRTAQLRHPSQLYEAFFEGFFLFLILWTLRRKDIFSGFSVAMYLIGYGVVRFGIEFFRQPDAHMGFVIGPFTMGQVLSFSMIALGAVVILFRFRKPLAGD